MENDSVMAVNKIVVTDTDDGKAPEDAAVDNIENVIQNKLGEIDTNDAE